MTPLFTLAILELGEKILMVENKTDISRFKILSMVHDILDEYIDYFEEEEEDEKEMSDDEFREKFTELVDKIVSEFKKGEQK